MARLCSRRRCARQRPFSARPGDANAVPERRTPIRPRRRLDSRQADSEIGAPSPPAASTRDTTLPYTRRVFRPCIDLHEGKVKQIVGGSLRDDAAGLRTNFVSEKPAAWFAELYRRDGLKGGHVIQLGPGNEAAARAALAAHPGGLHLGGGLTLDNARAWLDAGASHVIVTSWVFREGRLDEQQLQQLVAAIGKERLVLDLSCRKRDGQYWVVTDRWQKFTELAVNGETLQRLAGSCAEFLVHAVDVEGLCRGVDLELVEKLSQWSPIPTTYAGGASSLADLEEVTRISRNRIDLTVGSALDIFGGSGVRYADAVEFNRRMSAGEK
ncbi:MAG: phosphoribosylformimino-5-aminoimidazole carboxamide ribotide isomerase [Verrucomicrobia bacterium]|nr:phosphoribosylformimino-5-aminoimidazole carboxamide ribotide isomerase [Verrucomicrobiota bacterium]